MQTKPERAYVQLYRFLGKQYGCYAAIVFELLRKKRELLLKGKDPQSWFYYLNNDLIWDFPCNEIKTIKPLIKYINLLATEGLINFETRKHNRYGKVVYYQINDHAFEKISKEKATCWLRREHGQSIESHDKDAEQQNHSSDTDCDPLGFMEDYKICKS